MLRLDRRFKQPTTITGQQQRGITSPQAVASVNHRHFPQRVKIPATGALKDHVHCMKQIEATGEWARWTSGGLGHRADQPMFLRRPVDNPTGVAQLDQTDQRGLRGMHDINLDADSRFGDREFSPSRIRNSHQSGAHAARWSVLQPMERGIETLGIAHQHLVRSAGHEAAVTHHMDSPRVADG